VRAEAHTPGHHGATGREHERERHEAADEVVAGRRACCGWKKLSSAMCPPTEPAASTSSACSR
jgi:hypothetical protein